MANTPAEYEVWLLKELVSAGHLTGENVKKLLDTLKKQNRLGGSATLEQVIVNSGQVPSYVLERIKAKRPKATSKENITTSAPQKTVVEDIAAEQSIHQDQDTTERYLSAIPDFKFEKFLGKGAIGSSYMGEFEDISTIVVKVFHPWILRQDGYLDSIKKFLSVIDYENHPNLLPHKVGNITEDHAFYYSVYLENDSLGDLIRATGRLELNSAIDVSKRIAEILKFFERIKRPHYGLCPENIFRDSNGQLFIKDFEWNRGFFNQAKDRIRVGPHMAYMSPEYMAGKTIDHKSDQYSLGVLMFYFLTKRLPFQGSYEQILEAKIEGKIPDITEIRRDVPFALAKIIEKMIQGAPSQRYDTFQEIIDELEGHLKKRQKELSARKQVPGDEKKITKRAPHQLVVNSQLNAETKAKKKGALPVILGLVCLFSIIYYFFEDDIKQQFQKNKAPKNNTVVNSKSEKVEIKPEPIEKLESEKVSLKVIEESEQAKWSAKQAVEKIDQEMKEKIDLSNERRKYNKREVALQQIKENLNEKKEIPVDQLNRAVEFQMAKIDEERNLYWQMKRPKLENAFQKNDQEQSKELVAKILEETGQDKIIEERITRLRVNTQKIDPAEANDKLWSLETKARNEDIKTKAMELTKEHSYGKLYELYSDALAQEKNDDQRMYYKNEAEFYEHASKVKNLIREKGFTGDLLLRELGLDEDGAYDMASSKGLHKKEKVGDIIPWNKISAKVLSSLAAKYQPNTLGENISLLIYANRAGNHYAMQTALRSLEKKYPYSLETPLVNEIKSSLGDVEDLLVTEHLKMQMGLARTLKNRRTAQGNKEAAKILIDLKEEYLSHPVYQSHEKEVAELLNNLQ